MSDKGHCVAHLCLSKGWGGLEMYPARVSPYQSKYGWRTVAICLAGGKVAGSFHEQGVEVFEVNNQLNALLKVGKLASWMKAQGVSVLHCHKSSDLRVAALLKKLTGCRVVFTEHMGVTRPKKDLIHRWIYSHVDQVLSISDATLARNLKALPVPPSKIKRLWLGTEFNEPNRSVSGIRQELGLLPHQLVIGLPGRLCPGKGHLILLDAFKLLLNDDNFKESRLLIVGGLTAQEGADEAFVTQLIARINEARLNEKVIFAGFRKDMPNLLAVMDVVCIPSQNEAFGLTAIEAMAAGKKLVVANSGALPEIVADTGLTASYDSATEFAAAIKQLQTTAHTRTGLLARERAKTEFDISRHTQLLCEQYHKILLS